MSVRLRAIGSGLGEVHGLQIFKLNRDAARLVRILAAPFQIGYEPLLPPKTLLADGNVPLGLI